MIYSSCYQVIYKNFGLVRTELIQLLASYEIKGHCENEKLC